MEKYINKLKSHWKIAIPLVLVLAGIGIFFLLNQKQPNTNETINSNQIEQLETSSKSTKSAPSTKKKETSSSSTKENLQTVDLVVDVKGEVKSPNIYHLKSDARVSDAIKLAGGLTDQADPKSINLAKKLADEEVVYVANKSENNSAIPTPQNSAGSSNTTSTAKININTADLAELQKLTGVGAKRAQDIIDYRTANGNFKSVDDLGNVSGFGPKSLEKLKDMIAI